MTDMPFGQWVREIREEQHLTMQQCAREAGIAWQVWQRIERARLRQDGSLSRPTRATVLKIADVLHQPREQALRIAHYLEEKEAREIAAKPGEAAVWTPDLQALYVELDAEDQEDLLHLAMLKWQRKHPDLLPPGLTTSSESAAPLAGDFICLNVHSGRMVSATSVEAASPLRKQPQKVMNTLLRLLTWQENPPEYLSEIHHDLDDIRQLLDV